MPPLSDSSSPITQPLATRRLDRRCALRLGAAALSVTCTGLGLDGPSQGLSSPSAAHAAALDQLAEVAITSGSVSLRARFDPSAGQFAVIRLLGFDTRWIAEAAAGGGLWIDGIRVADGPATRIDGSGGLQIVDGSPTSLRLQHGATGLLITLEYVAQPANAITHRVTLENGRSAGAIQIGSAATLALRLQAGDWTEGLAADDTPAGWKMLRAELPSSYGNHELRSAERGVYPVIRLATARGDGMLVAVSTATAWRVDVGREGKTRVLRAGEYQSDLVLQPGEVAHLPEVVTIFYRGGASGAVVELRRYLDAASAPPPGGWSRLPPAVFNTWFGYGCSVGDDGSNDSRLRRAARRAADTGLEVFVLDAGWYLGSAGNDPDNFSQGLGTWVEDPAKWRARPGQGGSPNAGLRNFVDYVHSLEVRGWDGSGAAKMRFGLWVEPERFDPSLDDPGRVPSEWAMPGAPILDFSRPEVVQSMIDRLQEVITTYDLDYLKVDANLAVGAKPAIGRSGHFWTRWSAGFEQLLEQVGRANPSLYIEHCASGLKRYWIGLPQLAHGSWLDDDVELNTVRRLLDATDALLLPRQKVVLIKDLPDHTRIQDVVAAYWGAEHRNGGVIGFSGELDRWNANDQQAAAEAVRRWKQVVRGSG